MRAISQAARSHGNHRNCQRGQHESQIGPDAEDVVEKIGANHARGEREEPAEMAPRPDERERREQQPRAVRNEQPSRIQPSVRREAR